MTKWKEIIFFKILFTNWSNIYRKEIRGSQINRITLKPNFGHRKKMTILNKDVEWNEINETINKISHS